ncbi:MAG: glycosyltransferase [Hyphomonadaceae bacterium]|nr:glycosyltransferase [Hyphomonadaceae bacterium]
MRNGGRSIEDGLFGVRFEERTPQSLFGRAILDQAEAPAPPPQRPRPRRPGNAAQALHEARFSLAEREPDLSARRTITWPQLIAGALLVAALGWATWAAPALVRQTAYFVGVGMFALVILIRVFAAAASLAPPRHAPMRWTGAAPIYTILCPLFKEARVAEALVASLSALDYPHDRLDVKLVLEEDDTETIAAIMRMGLPPPFSLCIVPSAKPQTKPKALNYALSKARGEFIVVYDAEDAPDPNQLWAALDAFAADPSLACVQAPLRIDNARARWISSQFAAEYAIQFDAILPLLTRIGLPVPLGGTSNHFRTDVLRRLGAWDPFNVTEDADLGYRLAREGWRTGMIAPPTWEEAPVSIGAWLKQRTRWIKGHMQTWLVLMRTPFRTARQMGLAPFLSIQFVLLAGIVAAFAHGPLAIALLAALLSPEALLSPYDLALAVAGYCTAIYGALAAAAATRDLSLAGAALTMPLYWPLSTIAALRALIELIVRPHHWAKTEHGVSHRQKRQT